MTPNQLHRESENLTFSGESESSSTTMPSPASEVKLASEFSAFCESAELLRAHPGNASVVTAECLKLSDFDRDDLLQLLSLVLILAIGALVKSVLSHPKLKFIGNLLPYTVAILLVGVGVGQLATRTCPLLQKYVQVGNYPPHFILLTFLPLLIFESAYSINVFTFGRTLKQILLLAIPGMILSTFATAIGSLYLFPSYDWTFFEASLFGSIISATDPVAVVAILREVGAPEGLSVLIEGESLLNDGVAVLLFLIFEELAEMHDEIPEWGPVITDAGLKLLRIGCGGPLFGYVIAKLLLIPFLARVFNDPTVEIGASLAAAYLTYYVGEEFLGVSGILAVCVLGLTLKNGASTCISPKGATAMGHFWEVMGSLANTLLFFIIGLVIGRKGFEGMDLGVDVPYLFELYGSILAVRFGMLLLLSPVLYFLGPFNWKSLIVTGWGGLRGAVGLCLALEVYESHDMCSTKETGKSLLGHQILFHTSGIVLLTLLVNGTTTRTLLNCLSLSKPEGDFAYVLGRLRNARERSFRAFRFNPKFVHTTNWDIVEKAIPTFKSSAVQPHFRTSLKRRTALMFPKKIVSQNNNVIAVNDASKMARKQSFLGLHGLLSKHHLKTNSWLSAPMSNVDLDPEIQVILLKLFKLNFRRQYEQGMIRGRTENYLLEICDRFGSIRTNQPSPLLTFEALNTHSKQLNTESADSCCGCVILQRYYSDFISSRIGLAFEVGQSYSAALDHLMHLLPVALLASADDGRKTVQETAVRSFLTNEKRKVTLSLNLLQVAHPEIIIARKSRQAARFVLNQMEARLDELIMDGIIERGDDGPLRQALNKMTKRIYSFPRSLLPSAVGFDQLSWLRDPFHLLPVKVVDQLRSKSILLTFPAGEILFRVGELPTGIFLIVTGLVKVEFCPTESLRAYLSRYGSLPVSEVILSNLEYGSGNTRVEQLIGPGGLLGEIGYLKGEARGAKVLCETAVTAVFLPADALNEGGEELKGALWSSWGLSVGLSVLQRHSKFANWNAPQIRAYLEKRVVPDIPPLSTFHIPSFVAEVLVLEGIFQDFGSKEVYIAPCRVPWETASVLQSIRNPVTVNKLLLVMHEDVSSSRVKLFLKKMSSTVYNSLGDIAKVPSRKNSEVEDEGTGPRTMTVRQRRKSLAILGMTGDGNAEYDQIGAL